MYRLGRAAGQDWNAKLYIRLSEQQQDEYIPTVRKFNLMDRYMVGWMELCLQILRIRS